MYDLSEQLTFSLNQGFCFSVVLLHLRNVSFQRLGKKKEKRKKKWNGFVCAKEAFAVLLFTHRRFWQTEIDDIASLDCISFSDLFFPPSRRFMTVM